MKISFRNFHFPHLVVLGSFMFAFIGVTPSHAITEQNLSNNSASYSLAHTSRLKVKNVKGVPGDSSITVSWTAPTYVSRYPILGYSVWANYKSPTTGQRVSTTPVDTADGSQTSVLLTGLRNGMAYDFTIVARSAAEWSAINTSSVVRPSTKPDVTQIVRAAAGKGKATIYWSRTFNGGATQKFMITTFVDGLIVGTRNNIYDNRTYPSAVIGSLRSGVVYTFTVTSINSNGSVESAFSPECRPTK